MMINSFRLYEILKSYEFRTHIELELEYLRTVLEVTNTYKSYKDFKRRIIDKAKEDLTKFCDITFSYEEKKGLKGKKIEALLFYIYKNIPSHRTVEENVPRPNTEDKSKELAPIEDKNKNIEITKIFKRDRITEVIEDFSNIESVKKKLTIELSPIVVSQFGVSLKVFIGLTETHTEGEIRKAIELTHKAIQTGKIDNSAGFFVEALRGKYTDAREQKKQIAVEQKAKLVETKRVEAAVEKHIKSQQQMLYEHEVSIFTQLIQDDTSFIQTLIDKVRLGMSGTYYKTDKTFEENLKHPLLKAAFLNTAKAERPLLFG